MAAIIPTWALLSCRAASTVLRTSIWKGFLARPKLLPSNAAAIPKQHGCGLKALYCGWAQSRPCVGSRSERRRKVDLRLSHLAIRGFGPKPRAPHPPSLACLIAPCLTTCPLRVERQGRDFVLLKVVVLRSCSRMLPGIVPGVSDQLNKQL
jgi:hypothetical protein